MAAMNKKYNTAVAGPHAKLMASAGIPLKEQPNTLTTHVAK